MFVLLWTRPSEWPNVVVSMRCMKLSNGRTQIFQVKNFTPIGNVCAHLCATSAKTFIVNAFAIASNSLLFQKRASRMMGDNNFY